MAMNKIDRRTGKPYLSVTRRDTIDLLEQLPENPDTNRALNHLRGTEAEDIHVDATRNWVLGLDVATIEQYGAFGDFYHYEGDRIAGAEHIRPIEWFQSVADRIALSCGGDNEFWQVLNRIFDDAIAVTDTEFGFERPVQAP